MIFRTDSEQNLAADIATAFRADASESMFFARELLRVRAVAFEKKFPQFKALTFVPRNTDLTPADESYTYQTYTPVGQTGTRHAYTRRGPRADVSGAEQTPVVIRPITSSFGYDMQEVRASMQARKNLTQRKANAARQAIAQKVDAVLATGGTINGVTYTGIANQASTLTYTTPTGVGGSKYWNVKTPDEVLVDLHAMASQIVTNSNEIETPNAMILPLGAFLHISSTRMGDGSDVTILRHFLATSPYIKTVEPWYKLDSNSAWTGGRAICYHRSPEKLEALLPVEFEQLAPEQSGFETLIQCHARIGGVVSYYPEAMIYADQVMA